MTNEKAMELQRWAEWCEYHRNDEYQGFVENNGGSSDGDDSSEGEED
jgi:hypothetical protein